MPTTIDDNCATIDRAIAEILQLRSKVYRMQTALGFFSSVIKSGEPWTETCEREYRAALAA